MRDKDANSAKPRFIWPRFVLAGFILGAALALVWMSVLVKRIQAMRTADPWSLPASMNPSATPTKAPAKVDLLAGFHEALLGGDAAAGRKVFFERPEANCAKCHKVGGQGGDMGPALDGVGAQRNRESILEAILYPNRHVLTNYESVILLLTNGTACSGMLKSENASNLWVNTLEEGLVEVRKSEVKLRQRGASPMPEGLGQLLPRAELRDLVEYIASLRDGGPVK